jgi:hypothetical protein
MFRQCRLQCSRCAIRFLRPQNHQRRLHASLALKRIGDSPQDAEADGSHQLSESRTRAEPVKLAEKKEKSPSRRNPLEPNKLDVFLASLHAAGREPTIIDLEYCRPQTHSSPDTHKYAEEYNDLVDTLCRSFSKSQLRKFALHYQLPRTSSMRKEQIAEHIIEKQWDWPSLRAIEKRKRDATEVSQKCV